MKIVKIKFIKSLNIYFPGEYTFKLLMNNCKIDDILKDDRYESLMKIIDIIDVVKSNYYNGFKLKKLSNLHTHKL